MTEHKHSNGHHVIEGLEALFYLAALEASLHIWSDTFDSAANMRGGVLMHRKAQAMLTDLTRLPEKVEYILQRYVFK